MTLVQRARRRGGFTIVEMAVALAVLGLLLAFTLPKVVGTASFAEDQKAQATASGAMDAIAQAFTSSRSGGGRVPFEATDCTDPAAPPAPRRQTDRDHALSDAEKTALGNGTFAPRPLGDNVASGYLRTDPGSLLSGNGYPTNCPAFAHPATLAASTGDVKFVRGDEKSTSSSVASVAAAAKATRWRVAAAVLAPQSRGTVASCWVLWRDFPMSGSDQQVARERYFVDTTVAADSPTDCTANPWLDIDPTADPALCTSADGAATAGAGASWRRPCGNWR